MSETKIPDDLKPLYALAYKEHCPEPRVNGFEYPWATIVNLIERIAADEAREQGLASDFKKAREAGTELAALANQNEKLAFDLGEQKAALLRQVEELREENTKLDEEVQCALGTNGLLFHLMRRLGLECEGSDKWRNIRAEKAEAQLAEATKPVTAMEFAEHCDHASDGKYLATNGVTIVNRIFAARAAKGEKGC